MSKNFWLSDVQWAAIEPCLPKIHTGPVRHDDRRVISGILHRLREACPWRDLPPDYGPLTTMCSRYVQWRQRGLWPIILAALATCPEPLSVTTNDSAPTPLEKSAPSPGHFWLSDAQWAAIAPHLSMLHRGPVRQNDRRVISGILYRLREGCSWRALPAEYGPCTTVANRYNRWEKRGLWQPIFAALASCTEPLHIAALRRARGIPARR